jgi:ribosome-binding factor A
MSRRTEKVASLMQEEIGEFLKRMELPALTTISKVEVTPDLKWCKVWVTVMGEKPKPDQVMVELKENLYDLQGELIRKFSMKIVPRVRFVLDHGEEYAAHINELLRKTHDEQ